MPDAGSVNVDDLVRALKQRRARLPFEIGAFVALELCEYLLHGPAAPSPSDVWISEEGTLSVSLPANSASGADAARSVVKVLGQLLVAAGQGVPPALLRLVEQGPESGQWNLSRLRDELEASLVPLNRAAARRVLARLIRETERQPDERARANERVAPEQELDADLDALLGDGGSVTDDVARPAPAPATPAAAVDEEAPTGERTAPGREPPSTANAAPPSSNPPAPAPDEAPPAPLPSERGAAMPSPPQEPRKEPPFAPEHAAPSATAHHGETPEPAPRPIGDAPAERLDDPGEAGGKRGWVWLLVFAVLIGALIGGVALFRPDAIHQMMGEPVAGKAAAEKQGQRERAQERQQMLEEHRRSFGDLIVRAEPKRAQILLFVGRGPAKAEHLPVGVAHEFVAIADGKRPTRAVVPKEAPWQTSGKTPRYELAMQAGDAAMNFAKLRIGESKLPQDVGQPTGKRGTVRVVTNPQGAKVYLLIGFAPQARVQDLSTNEAHELLVAHDDYRPKRVVVGPSDWQTGEESPVAEIEVTLDAQEGK